MRVLVVIPTYNEADNVGQVLARVRAAGQADPGIDVSVLVVDDASPDGTADAVRAAEGFGSDVSLLVRAEKAGLGTAYVAGFRWALDRDFDAVVEMDADLSHDPAALPLICAPLATGADLVIGSRYVAGGSTPDWAWNRKALSKWGNRYASLMLGLPVADATAGYRAYRTSLLAALDLDSVRAGGYGFQIEMTDRAYAAKSTIVEVPITFAERTRGRSKMSLGIVAEALALITRWGVGRRFRALGGRSND